MAEKKNILTYEGLKALEDELQDLKLNRRKEVAAKIKEAREQGDLSENAEYDAARMSREISSFVLKRSTRSSRMQRSLLRRMLTLMRSISAVRFA